MKNYLFISLVIICQAAVAQTISSDRTVNWSLAGYSGQIPDYKQIDITLFGGSGDGTTLNDLAFAQALQSLNGKSGVIYFPSGTYLFNNGISLSDSIIIRGESSSSTRLKFDLKGALNHLINISGQSTVSTSTLTNDANRTASSITVADASAFTAGDYIKLYQTDNSLLVSDWAYGSLGQLIKIESVNGNNINLASPLRRNYTTASGSQITKLLPKKHIGLECFSIERVDATTDQAMNINLYLAAQCWIIGVESIKVNYAHIDLGSSTNILVKGCYLRDAFNYGGGGQGYGVLMEFATGECLVENNIFNNLRHSMILQAGANGNVFGYNYSINPKWSQFPFPSNSAGDMVLHGNYPYANLFEGNIGQNIVIDNSHGINGPYNTFFRNRAELYGVVMNSNPASNDQNFVGNEITNTGSLMGNYALAGTGHFSYGNNLKGTISPAGTTALPESSLYLSGKPDFFSASSWPSIGTPYAYNQGTIPAKTRYTASTYTSCSKPITTGINDKIKDESTALFPNPTAGEIYLSKNFSTAEIINSEGRVIAQIKNTGNNNLDLSAYPAGLYLIKTDTGNYKVLKY